MKLCITMMVKDEAPRLVASLHHLYAADLPIMVFDNGSTDDTISTCEVERQIHYREGIKNPVTISRALHNATSAATRRNHMMRWAHEQGYDYVFMPDCDEV